MTKKVKINVRIEPEMAKRLYGEAENTGLTLTDIITRRLNHSFMNDIAYINYVNAQLTAAQIKDMENETNE